VSDVALGNVSVSVAVADPSLRSHL